jgi:2-methylcitrate dehydratase PrpD
VLRAVTGWGGAGPCGVLGRALRLPAPDAAFVNAFQIHSQEFDCVHEPAVVHPLATVAAALLAEIDRGAPVTGTELLTALVAGVDVAAGLGTATTTPLRFFRPATAGVFGSVAAVARLKRLTPETTRNALGYALAFASGTMQAHVEGKPALPVQVAQAARSAIQAIDLAIAGLPGPMDAIEGPFGYLKLFESGFDGARLRHDLQHGHRIAEVSWKPFPTGRAAHGAIVATQTLMREHQVTADMLASLVYHAPSLIHRLVGRAATATMTPAYARLCFPYLAGTVLQTGTVGLGDFTAQRLGDPVRLATAARVSVVVNDNPDPAAFTPAHAVARLHDGRTLRVDVAAQFGSPQWPLSREQHLQKARDCLAFGDGAALEPALLAWIEGLDRDTDVAASLSAALRHPTH